MIATTIFNWKRLSEIVMINLTFIEKRLCPNTYFNYRILNFLALEINNLYKRWFIEYLIRNRIYSQLSEKRIRFFYLIIFNCL